MNIALHMSVSDISGGGGAERFFSDFFERYHAFGNGKFNLFLFLDRTSYNNLQQSSCFTAAVRNENIVFLTTHSNRFKKYLEALDFISKIVFYRIKLVHFTNYGRHHYDNIYYIKKIIPKVKLVVNIVDCEVAHACFDEKHPKHPDYVIRYKPLFDNINIDGIFTWYKLFKERATAVGIIKSKPIIETIETRYCNTEKFRNGISKGNIFVYASRFAKQKNPLMFVEAVRILHELYPEKIRSWKFFMYGGGPLEGEIKANVEKYSLEPFLEMKKSSDLSQVFPETKCFVSTQDYENFPSLSMLESMACGNAVISRNVGQTDYFVKDGFNGFLLKEDSAVGLASAMKIFIDHPELHEKMQKESVRLAKEVHTPEKFIRSIEAFWERILYGKLNG